MPKTPKFNRQQICDLAVGCEHRTALRRRSQPAWSCAKAHYPNYSMNCSVQSKAYAMDQRNYHSFHEGIHILRRVEGGFWWCYNAARRIVLMKCIAD